MEEASLKVLNAVIGPSPPCLDLLHLGLVIPSGASSEARRILERDAPSTAKTFYGSWEAVLGRTRFLIFCEQVLHYATEGRALIHVPGAPDGTKGIRVVRGMTREEMREEAFSILRKKVALDEGTIGHLLVLLGDEPIDVSKVGNRDVRAIVSARYGILPEDPVEALRTIVAHVTGSPSLVKSADTTRALRAKAKDVSSLLDSRKRRFAEVFNRFKPLFLALKAEEKNRKPVNTISSLSKKLHVPFSKVKDESPFALVRRLKYLESYPPRAFFVRNGKTWVERKKIREAEELRNKVCELLPWGIKQSPFTSLAIPTSERSFAGAFPVGTRFSLEGLVVGIYWKDVDGVRTDVDLKCTYQGGCVGWNGDFSNGGIAFSGDVVAAPQGATELLLFRKVEGKVLLTANVFHPHDTEVDITVLVGWHDGTTAMLPEDNVVARIETKCGERGKVLGLVEGKVPCFTLIDKTFGGSSRVSRWGDDSEPIIRSFEALRFEDFCEVSPDGLDLTNETLSKAGVLEALGQKPQPQTLPFHSPQPCTHEER